MRAPGRVNLLGAHVDHNEGWVLPAAIDRSVWLAAASIDRPNARIHAMDFDQLGEINLVPLGQSKPRAIRQDLPFGWMSYPAGLAWAMTDSGYRLAGMEALFAGDIPIGAGVSSSAAVEMAFTLAWEVLSGFRLDNRERALLGQRAENEFLGVASGIMDQFACLHGQAGRVVFLDCRTLEHELIAFPEEISILVADSGVRRELVDSEYNVRRLECEQALATLKKYLPEIRALRDVSVEQFKAYAQHLPEQPRRRAQHVIEECARVLDGVEALRQGNLAAFGRLVRLSHLSSRDFYEVSIDELDTLASVAWQVPGCYGARLAGGGFGGCVVAIVEESVLEEVKDTVSDAFAVRFGRHPTLLACQVGPGAELESVSY